MCEPTTIMATMMIASTVYNAQAQREQGKYEKGVAEYNARMGEIEATQVRNKGVEEENIIRREAAELQSKQRAQLGAANVGLEFGSAGQLQEDTITLGEADALRIRANTDATVTALQRGAELDRSRGEFAESMGKSKAFGTVLSGAADVMGTGVADKWFKPNSQAVVSAGSIGLGPTTSKPSVFN